MQLTPTDQGAKFSLAPKAALTVGRQPQFQLTSGKISRQHVELVCSDDGHSVTAKAYKKCEVKHGSTGAITLLQAGQCCQLLPGDAIFLERDGAQLKSGFVLSAVPDTADAPTAGVVPALKRQPAATLPTAKRGKTEPEAALPEESGTPHASARFAAEAHGSADPVSPVEQQEEEQCQIFIAVQLAVWDQHHTQKAVALAAQAGAKVKLYVDSSTTHVIASYSLPMQEAEQHLQESNQHQQAGHKTSSGLSGSQGGSHVNRQLQFSSSQQMAALPSNSSQQQQDAGEHDHEQLHQLMSRVHLVTVKWLTDSLAAGRMLPEHSYHIQLHQYQYRLPRSASSISRRQQPQSQGHTEQQHQQAQPDTTAGMAVKLASDTQGMELPLGNNTQQQHSTPATPLQHLQGGQRPWQSRWNNIPPAADQICRPGEVWGTGGRWIEPWDEAAASETVEQLLSHWHRVQSNTRQQRTAKAAAASAAAAEQEGSLGAGDRGISDGLSSDDGSEYSDDSAAAERRTKRRLQRYQSVAAAADAAAVNTVCSHAACCRQAFCFVAEMERLKSTYSRGREDQFRIKAANRAIHELENTERPLVTTADVAALGLGDKTSDKLLEILQTGKLRRNEEVAGNEAHRVMAMFMGVWGVAETTAEKWYQAGCKTVQDVRDKVDHLTAQQRVGLKYYDDFEQRIPRDEATEAENIVHDVVADVLQELTGKRQSDVTQLMHARVTGSYLRGRHTCGDIDFIIAPGPACADLVGLGALMTGILDRLTAQQYVTQDMLPLEPRKSMRGPHDELTWMGVWKGPSSPCHRRIDIKVYPRDALAFAVNYFASGQDMCRALRYWCNTPVPRVAAAAAALNPAGNAFRLSDRDLVVIRRVYEGVASRKPDGVSLSPVGNSVKHEGNVGGTNVPPHGVADPAPATMEASNMGYSRMGNSGRGAVRETIVGPAIRCTCETDIFRAIGLSYVPPHMRDIT